MLLTLMIHKICQQEKVKSLFNAQILSSQALKLYLFVYIYMYKGYSFLFVRAEKTSFEVEDANNKKDLYYCIPFCSMHIKFQAF